MVSGRNLLPLVPLQIEYLSIKMICYHILKLIEILMDSTLTDQMHRALIDLAKRNHQHTLRWFRPISDDGYFASSYKCLICDTWFSWNGFGEIDAHGLIHLKEKGLLVFS